MNYKELENVFRTITTSNISDRQKDDAVTTILNLAAQSFTKEVMQSLLSAKEEAVDKPTEGKEPPQAKLSGKAESGLTFTKKEIKSMPQKYRKIFAQEGFIVPYRLRKDGVYEARLRRKDDFKGWD